MFEVNVQNMMEKEKKEYSLGLEFWLKHICRCTVEKATDLYAVTLLGHSCGYWSWWW